jgi:hypothetical protein
MTTPQRIVKWLSFIKSLREMVTGTAINIPERKSRKKDYRFLDRQRYRSRSAASGTPDGRAESGVSLSGG